MYEQREGMLIHCRIQIYTVPREPKRPRRTGRKSITLWSRLSSLSLSSGKSLSTPSPTSSASASSVSVPSTSTSSFTSHDRQDGEAEDGTPGRRASEQSRTSLTHTRVTEVPPSPSHAHARQSLPLETPPVEGVGEEDVTETIAYITFTDEIHRASRPLPSLLA